MRGRLIAALLVFLAGAGPVLGQTQAYQPPFETLPYPTPVRPAPVEILPPLEAVPEASGMVIFDADSVLWFSPNRRRPTSVAVSDPAGIVGDTLGDEHLNRHTIPGARVGLGYWWTTDNPWVPGGKMPTYGIETRFLFVSQRSFSFTDDQSPILVRPFFDLNDQRRLAVVIAAPGLATGVLSGRASERLWGAEANVWKNLYYDWPGTTCSVEGMVGLRYLNLDDGILLARASSFAAAPVGFPDFAFLAGNRIAEQESFATRNSFVGGQLGIRGNLIFDRAVVSGQFQLGLGNTNERISIQGNQLRTLPNGQRIVSPGALLALPSNIGHHYRNEFAQVPELGVKIAVPINNHLTLAAGFTTLYWSRIARPADQLDRSVEITQVPSFPGAAAAAPTGLARPAVPFNQSDLWLMGFMISVEMKW